MAVEYSERGRRNAAAFSGLAAQVGLSLAEVVAAAERDQLGEVIQRASSPEGVERRRREHELRADVRSRRCTGDRPAITPRQAQARLSGRRWWRP